MNNDKILVFGHKNPDTDTICSALIYADLKSKLGGNVEAVRLGEINEETAFALNYFNVAKPRLVNTVSDEVAEVALVDHNEFQQSVDDIENVKIIEVVDHHRIANFQTKEPLHFRVEPVGCTTTILRKMYQENNLEITKQIAGLMVSAIISDSLLFKSPTCTEEDVQAAKSLAEIAEINLDEYGLEMLKAGTKLENRSAEEIISIDSKEFPMGDKLVEVAQVNTVDVAEVLARKNELSAAMNKTIEEKGLDVFVLAITDILEGDSTILTYGAGAAKVGEAFDVALTEDTALLKGVVSRKKQIIPALTKAIG
ncbi:manganese-dependent inorganic pyrophosphatase [Alkalihalophilus marmarensis]|uniref:manganese-dependent inorganic pyrophosphatase n=1 Tax=Alkalihalophilus marmarensis TaxID=521377 RepID=UPI002E1D319E|nr:manganese-dependent inorganic pyrophosphatase [Alkalihalophilus marmarensis]MED1602575.1 manganese-dependent inorganic pyrophosphatase [Alkalihalophilus marmarensis]